MISQASAIIVLFAGVCAAVFYGYFTKKVLGDFLRALDDCGADSEDAAKTINELGFGGIYGLLIRMSLGKGAALRRFVGTAIKPEDENDADNIPGQKYYIFPEKQNEALRRYKKDGTSIPVLIGCVALLLVLAIVCTIVVPYIQNMIGAVPDSFDAGSDSEVSDSAGDITDNTVEDTAENISDVDGESSESDKKVPQTRFETVE